MRKGEKMLSKEKLARINELARKAKTVGLSDEERREQGELRAEYLVAFRKHFTDQLHTIKVIDRYGRDVTPEKLKASKKKRSLH
jgi:uncharacterized protein YnzC (UPF0291/DUF896 family)